MERHRDTRSTVPAVNDTKPSSQPVAERPRTGTTASTNTTSHTSTAMPALAHSRSFTAHNTGIAATTRMLNCTPVSPKNMPTRSRV